MGSINPDAVLFSSMQNNVTMQVGWNGRLYNESSGDPEDTFFQTLGGTLGDARTVKTAQIVAAFQSRNQDVPQMVASMATITGAALGLPNLKAMEQTLMLTEMGDGEAENYVCSVVQERMSMYGESMTEVPSSVVTTSDRIFTAKVHGVSNYVNLQRQPHLVGSHMEFYIVPPTESRQRVQTDGRRSQENGLIGAQQIMIGVRPVTRKNATALIKNHLRLSVSRPGLFLALHNRGVVPTSIVGGSYNFMQMLKTCFVNALVVLLDTTGLTLVPRGDTREEDPDFYTEARRVRRPEMNRDFAEDEDEDVYQMHALPDETNPSWRKLLYKSDITHAAPTRDHPEIDQVATESFDIGVILAGSLGIIEMTDAVSDYDQRFSGHVLRSILNDGGGMEDRGAITSRLSSMGEVSALRSTRQLNYDIEHALMSGLMKNAAEYEPGVMFGDGQYRGNISKVITDSGAEEPNMMTEFGRLLDAVPVNTSQGLAGFVDLLLAQKKNSAGLCMKTTNPWKMGAVFLSQVGRVM